MSVRSAVDLPDWGPDDRRVAGGPGQVDHQWRSALFEGAVDKADGDGGQAGRHELRAVQQGVQLRSRPQQGSQTRCAGGPWPRSRSRTAW